MKSPQALVRRLSLGQAAMVMGLALSLSSPAWAKYDKALHTKALELAIAGDTKSSLVALRSLEKEKLPDAELAQVQLSIGRVLYQAGDYNEAVVEYRKITPGTDAWFQALEERAWSYMQLNQPDDALAQLKTVLSPLFKDRASSEAYFLSALAHMRICDYPALFKDLDQFKTRYRDRVKTWKATASFDGAAADHLKDVTDTIQKLNIVEAEAIQRLYMDDDLKKKAATPPRITKRADDLTFPVSGDDEKEVWLDEVDNYQVRVSGCPKDSLKTTQVASPARHSEGHAL